MKQHIYNPSLLSLNKLNDKGSNSESVLLQNRRLLLQLIKDMKIVTRKQLAEKTGLKLATITLGIADLLENGIIEDAGFIPGNKGRKVKGFSIAQGRFCTIAIRVNISYVKIAVYTLDNENLFVKKAYMNTLGDLNKTCNLICQEVKNLEPVIGGQIVMGIGLGVDGPFVIRDGYYKLPQALTEDGYFDIAKVLSQQISYPVIVNKSTNFGVYHVWKKNRKEADLGTYIYIPVSYTVECGIIFNGEILNGTNGTSGMLGRSIVGQNKLGSPLTLQDVTSSSSVLRRVAELLPLYPNSLLNQKIDGMNIRDVIKGYTLGDELAMIVFTEVGVQLGQAVANLINLLNPDYVEIDDEIPKTGELRNTVLSEAMRHISKEAACNINVEIMNYDQARSTQLDPSLLGASEYVSDVYFQSLNFDNK